MYNWNDVRVEQEIAEERYERIVEARHVARVQREDMADGRISWPNRLLGLFGDFLVRWGCALQKRRGPDVQSAICRSATAG